MVHEDYDDGDDSDVPCPACGHHETRAEPCEVCGGDGTREYDDAPEEWGEDCPSEVNHLIDCRECHGTGLARWCPKCGADYWVAKKAAKSKYKARR